MLNSITKLYATYALISVIIIYVSCNVMIAQNLPYSRSIKMNKLLMIALLFVLPFSAFAEGSVEGKREGSSRLSFIAEFEKAGGSDAGSKIIQESFLSAGKGKDNMKSRRELSQKLQTIASAETFDEKAYLKTAADIRASYADMMEEYSKRSATTLAKLSYADRTVFAGIIGNVAARGGATR